MTKFEITALKKTEYTFTIEAHDEDEASKIIDEYIDDDFNDASAETTISWMITIEEGESDDDSNEEDGNWMDGDALASAGFGTDEDYGGSYDE